MAGGKVSADLPGGISDICCLATDCIHHDGASQRRDPNFVCGESHTPASVHEIRLAVRRPRSQLIPSATLRTSRTRIEQGLGARD